MTPLTYAVNYGIVKTVKEIERKIRTAPAACGVYIMKDSAGKVIYVGKAKSLRKRIASYFNDKEGRYQVRFLLKKLCDIEYILTSNESEALLLENNLIKKYSPRYNIQLKDDKNYLCIMIDMKKKFPRIELVRRIQRPEALYFGPYPSARTIREVINTLLKIFPLRHCSDYNFGKRKKPCLYYEINQCLAPCAYPEKREQYVQILGEAVLFLKGKSRKIVNALEKRMWDAADAKDYERAAFIRDIIKDKKGLLEKQGVISSMTADRDIIGSFSAGLKTNFVILFIRGGRMLHKKEFSLPSGPSLEDAFSQFIVSYYTLNIVPPDLIVPEITLPDAQNLEKMLSLHFSKDIRIAAPRDEKTKRLMKMAVLNASTFSKPESEGLEALTDALNLQKTPERIECFDAAHMHGKQNTCAMSVFENGKPVKSEYRIFNIDEETRDDYKMLYAALKRRLAHTEWRYPDILLMDGGKGQLSVAVKALKEMNISSIYPIAMTKDEGTSIYLPNRKNPLVLQKGNEGLKMLSMLREEAHRFANAQLRRRLKKSIRATV